MSASIPDNTQRRGLGKNSVSWQQKGEGYKRNRKNTKVWSQFSSTGFFTTLTFSELREPQEQTSFQDSKREECPPRMRGYLIWPEGEAFYLFFFTTANKIMWPDLESLREEGWGKTPSPVAAASSQARPKAVVGFVTPGPSDKHEPIMRADKEGGEMETNPGIITTFLRLASYMSYRFMYVT